MTSIEIQFFTILKMKGVGVKDRFHLTRCAGSEVDPIVKIDRLSLTHGTCRPVPPRAPTEPCAVVT